MALKAFSMWGCSQSQVPKLGLANCHLGNSRQIVNLRSEFGKCQKWECCCLGVLAQRAANPVEDEKPVVEISGPSDVSHENDSKGFHKDLNLLPSKLYMPFSDCHF